MGASQESVVRCRVRLRGLVVEWFDGDRGLVCQVMVWWFEHGRGMDEWKVDM